jgi:DNA-binding GntR family transcriptional regulator
VLDLTQSQLGAMVGLSRPKLNARLRALQREGWVELRPRGIRVLDAPGLRATALARLRPAPRRRTAS